MSDETRDTLKIHPHDGYAYDGCRCVCCTNIRFIDSAGAPAPTVDAAALREAVEALRWPDSLAAADQPMRGWNGAIDKVLALPALRASAPPHRETSDAS